MRKSELVFKSLLAVLMVVNMVVLYQYIFGVKGPADGELPFAIMQEVGGWLSDDPSELETVEISPSTATTVTTVAERLTPTSPRESASSARAVLVDNTGYTLANRPLAETTSPTRPMPSAVAETTLTSSAPVILVTVEKPDDEKAEKLDDKKAEKPDEEVGFGTAAQAPEEAKPAAEKVKPPPKPKPAPQATEEAKPAAEKPVLATAKASPAQKKAAPKAKVTKSAKSKAVHKQQAAKPAQKRAAPATGKAAKSTGAQSHSEAASGGKPSPSKGKKK